MPDSQTVAGSHGFRAELNLAIAAAQSAAELVMDLRATAAHSIKGDGSIVTTADIAASELICDRIRRAFPDDAILTEEAVDNPCRLEHERCWLIDPIDGTQQFADGQDDFDVYIALAERGRVTMGVAINPPTGLQITAVSGAGAFVSHQGRAERIMFAERASGPVFASRPWLGVPENIPALEVAASAVGGSVRDLSRPLSVRSLLPGQDHVDVVIGLYLDGHEPGSNEWDLAVLDIVIREAGGNSIDLHGNPLLFNKADPRFPGGLVMATDPALIEPICRALRT